MIKQFPRLRKPSWLSRAVLTVTSILAIAAGVVLASALFTILLVAGLAAAGWLWWQFRKLARQAQATAPEIIDGEYTVEPGRPLLEDQRPAVQQSGKRRGRRSP